MVLPHSQKPAYISSKILPNMFNRQRSKRVQYLSKNWDNKNYVLYDYVKKVSYKIIKDKSFSDLLNISV
jgi:hypothetical protein